MIQQPAFGSELSGLQVQVEALRERNQALRERLQRQRDATERLSRRVESLEGKDEALSKEITGVAARPMEHVVEDAGGPPGISAMPKVTLMITGDMGYTSRFIGGGEAKHEFNWGEHGLFVSGALTDRLSVLVETHFSEHVDLQLLPRHMVERAAARYSFSDLVNTTVGLIETPLGYWNQAFHRANWLHTTIERPDVYEPERPEATRGGILPIHSLGVNLAGALPLEGVDIAYEVGVFNGRKKNRTSDQGFGDDNDFKAINTLVSLKPHALEGFQVGADVYVDKIPSYREVAGGLRAEEIDELIVGGYGAYVQGGTELLAEVFWIDHDDHASEQTFLTWAGYLQGSRRLGRTTPYYRFDFVDLGNGDPYYFDINPVTGAIRKRDPIVDHLVHTVGLRWDVFSWNALKFEYSYIDNHDHILDEHRLAVNTSYVF
jgi:FtsZ-binding cell division protein ZapB